MVWTTFTTELDPDKPGRSVDIKAINANITAQANGDTGAPKTQTAGIADLAVTRPKIADGQINSAKLASVGAGTGSTVTVAAGDVAQVLGSQPAGTQALESYLKIYTDSGTSTEASLSQYGACNAIQTAIGSFKVKNGTGVTLYFETTVIYLVA